MGRWAGYEANQRKVPPEGCLCVKASHLHEHHETIIAAHETDGLTLLAMNRTALSELETTLYGLRWCAVAGQTISLLFAARQLQLALPWHLLTGGVILLAVGNALLTWRRSRSAATEPRVLAGLALDISALTWALYFSGGVMNPFTMLYLLPVALTATVLKASRVICLALAGIMGYGILGAWAPPLPHVHGQGALDLHLAGMGVNFLLSMAVLSAFGLRLAALLRSHSEALSRERERGLRDEGLHALALQAAMAAHSVNTPLATMALLVDELREAPSSGEALQADLDILGRQLDHARQALRRLVDSAKSTTPAAEPIESAMARLAERAALLRPAVPLTVHIDPTITGRTVSLPPLLQASIGNLLDNSADSCSIRSETGILLIAEPDGSEFLQLRVLDRGMGRPGPSQPGISDKPDGLGWGLALANAALEWFGGELRQRTRDGGGTESRLRLPWTALNGVT